MDAGIVLLQPQFDENVGSTLRTCHNWDVSFLVVVSQRKFKHAATNTTKTHRHIPVIVLDNVEALTQVVGFERVIVEICENSVTLPHFKHPKRALYIFGPENGSVPRELLVGAEHRVRIPSRHCLNLATAAAVTLYDRRAKAMLP